jgi:hypothetical protein
MTPQEIAHFRVSSQKLINTQKSDPKEMVSHFGAIQAQDYAMAKWAVGARCGVSEKTIEEALNSGQIIRTHILRPTWHFVAADDIFWMLELAAPQVKKFTAAIAKKYDLDAKKLDQINTAIEKLLVGNTHLTRDEIMRELNFKNVSGAGFKSALIMMNAELDGLVCNGKMKGKKSTYALLKERVGESAKKLTKEEGLAKLAKKYFESHGPATVADFSWWSGFSITNAKLAINLVESTLISFQSGPHTYWFGASCLPNTTGNANIQFLPSYDEFLISYKNREASITLENQSRAFLKNGIFRPIIVENGQVIGTWKRTVKKECVKVETQFFEAMDSNKRESLFEGVKPYENYLETKIVIK